MPSLESPEGSGARGGNVLRPCGSGDAEERIAFLASAGELLSGSLEWRTVLQRLAELMVPVLADGCAVDFILDDGRVERVAATHHEPAKVALLHQLSRLLPPSLESPGALAEVLRTGTPLFLPEVTEGMLPGLVRTGEQLAVANQLDIRAGIIVPLRGRGRTLGSVSLLRGGARAGFNEADLELALELARRASLSVDNALLYAEAREAQVRTERLQAVTAALSRAVTAEEVARVVLHEGLRLTGAVRGTILELGPEDGVEVRGSFGYPPDVLEYLKRVKVQDAVLLRQSVERREPLWFSRMEPPRYAPDLTKDMAQSLGEGARVPVAA